MNHKSHTEIASVIAPLNIPHVQTTDNVLILSSWK